MLNKYKGTSRLMNWQFLTLQLSKHFFEDFYSCAADYVYSESVDVYLSDVKVKERYDKEAIIDIPYNQELSVKFG